jgi:hypothetical protein
MKATDTFKMSVIDYDITCYHNPLDYCNGGVPGAKWQPVSPKRVCLHQVALVFGSVRSLGVLDKEAPSGIWHDSNGEKIVLEPLSSISGALAATITTRNALISHCRAPGLECTLTP